VARDGGDKSTKRAHNPERPTRGGENAQKLTHGDDKRQCTRQIFACYATAGVHRDDGKLGTKTELWSKQTTRHKCRKPFGRDKADCGPVRDTRLQSTLYGPRQKKPMPRGGGSRLRKTEGQSALRADDIHGWRETARRSLTKGRDRGRRYVNYRHQERLAKGQENAATCT